MENFTSCVTGEFKKFYPDGNARTFKGNTFICHIPKDSSFFRFANYSAGELSILDFHNKLALLPKDSYHMTIFEGICDDVRIENNWVKNMPLDTPFTDMMAYFFNSIPKLYKPEGFTMNAKKLRVQDNFEGIQFLMEPYNLEEEKKLKRFRKVIKDVTGMVNHNEENYEFHVSISYIIMEFTDSEKESIFNKLEMINKRLTSDFNKVSLGPVEYCYFDNMLKYFTISILKD